MAQAPEKKKSFFQRVKEFIATIPARLAGTYVDKNETSAKAVKPVEAVLASGPSQKSIQIKNQNLKEKYNNVKAQPKALGQNYKASPRRHGRDNRSFG